MDWFAWPMLVVPVYALGVALWFRSKLNHGETVPTTHGTDGAVDAIEFFWRPG